MGHYPTTVILTASQIKQIFNGHYRVVLHLSCPCCARRVTLQMEAAPAAGLAIIAKDPNALGLTDTAE